MNSLKRTIRNVLSVMDFKMYRPNGTILYDRINYYYYNNQEIYASILNVVYWKRKNCLNEESCTSKNNFENFVVI